MDAYAQISDVVTDSSEIWRVAPEGEAHTKTCSVCGRDVIVDDYFKDSRSSDGLQSYCKECDREKCKRYREANRGKVAAVKKKCYTARRGHYIQKAKAHYTDNKDDVLATYRARYLCDEEFRERKKAVAVEWGENHRELTRARAKSWRLENPDRALRRYTERRASDTGFRLAENMRSRVRTALCGTKKSAGTEELIGCSGEVLRDRMESMFWPGMTWENYGNPNGDHTDCWHVDHIIPCAVFELTDPVEQKQCFHYMNLQPLWAKDNLRKSARVQHGCV